MRKNAFRIAWDKTVKRNDDMLRVTKRYQSMVYMDKIALKKLYKVLVLFCPAAH